MTRGDVMQKKQKGFLVVLCLCMLSVSGICGIYQYQKGLSQEPEEVLPQETAQVEEDLSQPETEAANSSDTAAQLGTEDKSPELAMMENDLDWNLDQTTEEDLEQIGEATLAQADTKLQPAAKSFSFTEESTLLWPVDGDVILNYSMDKSIYFSTLNQYKYHPAVVISADTGSEVICAAAGKVETVTVSEETGTTLRMDLGDGYESIYGQLKEVSAKEGDTLEAGELLGYVSEPTKYYTMEGSNLYFQLLKDGDPVNPLDYLE
jgi:murein DD-endopeptidase MepM/ murein hydrolase activator NlpD